MITKWIKVETKKGVEYSVRLVFNGQGRISKASGCDCRWGSFYRYSEANKEIKFICRHMVVAYSWVIGVKPTKARDNLVKMKLMDPTHLRRINDR